MIKIKTYQDLKQKRDKEAPEAEIMEFVREVINDHKESELYKKAFISNEYANQRNVNAVNREKLYRDIAGRLTKNQWTPCHRMRTNLFHILAEQENSYLLGNGVTLSSAQKKEKLGKDFDVILSKAGYFSKVQIVSYLFWNLDHAEFFKNLEFAPLMDEKTSSLRAGVRWWQVDANKPLRATLYEENGCTEYIWNLREDGKINENGEILVPKKAYKTKSVIDPNGEYRITEQQNYPSLPIFPLWGNTRHLSQFSGIQDTIDTIDELTNSLNDDLTENQLYWLIQGADGMDKSDLAQLLDDIRQQKIINPAEGQNVQPYTVNIPVAERQSEIARLKAQVYEDYQGLNIDEIKSGNVVTAQIEAAYEPLNHKTDDYEMNVNQCLCNMFQIVPGLENEKPTFNRSVLANRSETASILNSLSQYLSQDFITEMALNILGASDRLETELQKQKEDEAEKFNFVKKVQNLTKDNEASGTDDGEAV